MTALATLRRSAAEAARWRGHTLRWLPEHDGRQAADCIADGCTADVSVDTNPPPNGIDIGGSAVAVNHDSIVRYFGCDLCGAILTIARRSEVEAHRASHMA